MRLNNHFVGMIGPGFATYCDNIYNFIKEGRVSGANDIDISIWHQLPGIGDPQDADHPPAHPFMYQFVSLMLVDRALEGKYTKQLQFIFFQSEDMNAKMNYQSPPTREVSPAILQSLG